MVQTSSSLLRLLLVEDDPGDALLVQEMLKQVRDKIDVTWASEVASATRLAKATSFDCALVDLGLPDSEGFDVVRDLLSASSGLPIVVLTGFDDHHKGEEALLEGAQDYLTKGAVTTDGLYRSIRYAIARHRGEEDARRLLQAESAQAENARLERGLLARPLLKDTQFHMATRYRPGSRRAVLGGDFFDVIELHDGTVRAVIGDVSGHGPDEAALGVALRVAWRALVLADTHPTETFTCLHRLLQGERQSDESYATACDIELAPDRRELRLHMAGHPGPVLLRGISSTAVVPSERSPVLGIVDNAKWCATQLELGDDWAVITFTDGILERRTAEGTTFETTDLASFIQDLAPRAENLQTLVNRLVSDTEKLNGRPLRDDVAVLAFSTSPRWAPSA